MCIRDSTKGAPVRAARMPAAAENLVLWLRNSTSTEGVLPGISTTRPSHRPERSRCSRYRGDRDASTAWTPIFRLAQMISSDIVTLPSSAMTLSLIHI